MNFISGIPSRAWDFLINNWLPKPLREFFVLDDQMLMWAILTMVSREAHVYVHKNVDFSLGIIVSPDHIAPATPNVLRSPKLDSKETTELSHLVLEYQKRLRCGKLADPDDISGESLFRAFLRPGVNAWSEYAKHRPCYPFFAALSKCDCASARRWLTNPKMQHGLVNILFSDNTTLHYSQLQKCRHYVNSLMPSIFSKVHFNMDRIYETYRLFIEFLRDNGLCRAICCLFLAKGRQHQPENTLAARGHLIAIEAIKAVVQIHRLDIDSACSASCLCSAKCTLSNILRIKNLNTLSEVCESMLSLENNIPRARQSLSLDKIYGDLFFNMLTIVANQTKEEAQEEYNVAEDDSCKKHLATIDKYLSRAKVNHTLRLTSLQIELLIINIIKKRNTLLLNWLIDNMKSLCDLCTFKHAFSIGRHFVKRMLDGCWQIDQTFDNLQHAMDIMHQSGCPHLKFTATTCTELCNKMHMILSPPGDGSCSNPRGKGVCLALAMLTSNPLVAWMPIMQAALNNEWPSVFIYVMIWFVSPYVDPRVLCRFALDHLPAAETYVPSCDILMECSFFEKVMSETQGTTTPTVVVPSGVEHVHTDVHKQTFVGHENFGSIADRLVPLHSIFVCQPNNQKIRQHWYDPCCDNIVPDYELFDKWGREYPSAVAHKTIQDRNNERTEQIRLVRQLFLKRVYKM